MGRTGIVEPLACLPKCRCRFGRPESDAGELTKVGEKANFEYIVRFTSGFSFGQLSRNANSASFGSLESVA